MYLYAQKYNSVASVGPRWPWARVPCTPCWLRHWCYIVWTLASLTTKLQFLSHVKYRHIVSVPVFSATHICFSLCIQVGYATHCHGTTFHAFTTRNVAILKLKHTEAANRWVIYLTTGIILWQVKIFQKIHIMKYYTQAPMLINCCWLNAHNLSCLLYTSPSPRD